MTKKLLVALILFFSLSNATVSQACTVPNNLTNGTNADATQVMANFSAVLNCLNNLSSGTPPQGRLTLASATPVMTSSVSGASSVIYTPYVGNLIPIYNGTNFVATAFAELSNINANSNVGNAGPAAVTANSCYDYFVWSNAGTPTLTRGPSWTSITTRSAGTALTRVNGIWLNNAAITNGPAASMGTYVGTACSNPSAAFDYIFGTIANPPQSAFLMVWNAYNRVDVATTVQDNNTSTWTSTANAVWQPLDSTNTGGSYGTINRATFVVGLSEDGYSSRVSALGISTNSQSYISIAFDTTASQTGTIFVWNGSIESLGTALLSGLSPVGLHYLQAVQYATSSNYMTWYGGTQFSVNLRN